METLKNASGFLGTGAGLLADITLVVQVLFFIVICVGVVAQLKQRYKLHDWLMAPVVLLNLLFIFLVMIPAFRLVIRELPGGLGRPSVLVPLVHGLLGLATQALATYGLLAGLKILPRRIGVLRYWMWAIFVAWTFTLLFGVGIYLVWYTGADAADSPAAPTVTPATATPEMVNEHAGDEIPQLIEEGDAGNPDLVDEHAGE